VLRWSSIRKQGSHDPGVVGLIGRRLSGSNARNAKVWGRLLALSRNAPDVTGKDASRKCATMISVTFVEGRERR